jgi:hypothetical protein
LEQIACTCAYLSEKNKYLNTPESLLKPRECSCKWRALNQLYSAKTLNKQRSIFIVNSKGVEIKFTLEDNEEAIKKMRRYGELSQDEPNEPENESLNRIFLREIELD